MSALQSRVSTVGNRTAVFCMQPHAPAFAYAWDHVVQGKTLIPGAALFEVAAAASRLLAVHGPTRSIGLLDATIPMPSIMRMDAPLVMQCEVSFETSAVTLRSSRMHSLEPIGLHIKAQVGTYWQTNCAVDNPQRPFLARAVLEWGMPGAPLLPSTMRAFSAVDRSPGEDTHLVGVHPAVLDNNFQVLDKIDIDIF
jgi:Polyketide synthase dehydratase